MERNFVKLSVELLYGKDRTCQLKGKLKVNPLPNHVFSIGLHIPGSLLGAHTGRKAYPSILGYAFLFRGCVPHSMFRF